MTVHRRFKATVATGGLLRMLDASLRSWERVPAQCAGGALRTQSVHRRSEPVCRVGALALPPYLIGGKVPVFQ